FIRLVCYYEHFKLGNITLKLTFYIKMNLMRKLVLLSTLFLLLISCNKDFEMIKIDSDILVSITKVDNDILISAQTERDYSTLGHQIAFCEKVKKKEIYIEFKKVKVPAAGLTALGPATCNIDLG